MIRTLILAAAGGGVAVAPTTWNLTVQTTGASQDYSVDINAGTTPNIVIDWGDTGVDTYTTTGIKTHTYSAAGIYTVKISGSFASGGNIRLDVTATRARLKATGVICPIPGLLNFQQTFQACSGLTALPVDLFRYNTLVSTSGFYATFYGCTGLTSLPTDLFRYNTAVSTQGFIYTFFGCSGLTALPVDLFRYNTAVSTNGFYRTFNGCTGLTSLPTDLFRYNTAVSAGGFYRTFYGCTKLTLNANIFFADGEAGTRFLNRASNFQECFLLTSFSGTQGVAPALWDCDFGTETPVRTDCFQGHSSSTVSNYSSIPAEWI
jgi:hypothetical protein